MEKQSFLNYDENTRTAYLVTLASIATADKQNTAEEVAFIEQMTIAAGLSEGNRAIVTKAVQDASSVNLNNNLNTLKGSDLKFAMVADILNLAYADKNLDAKETEQIKQVNVILGINDDQLKALQEYVNKANQAAASNAGNVELDSNGQPKNQTTNFLETSGLSAMFTQMGIPVEHFNTGSTIGAKLTSTAFFLLKSYVSANTQGNANTLGETIGSFIGSVLGGGNTQQQGQQGQQNQQGGGLQQMVAGFFSSQAGSATINNVLNNVVNNISQGKGIGNLSSILGGSNAQQGQQQQGLNLQNVLSMLMK
ncbi:MAG: TerB family tellurite resistance protein [Cytophagales bacterium]|nr:MAG: TerB family tellurite resistance protein [Cytophagales bacterium]